MACFSSDVTLAALLPWANLLTVPSHTAHWSIGVSQAAEYNPQFS